MIGAWGYLNRLTSIWNHRKYIQILIVRTYIRNVVVNIQWLICRAFAIKIWRHVE